MFPDVACLRCDGTNPMKLWPKSKVRKFTCSRLTEDCEAREKYLSNEEGGQAEDMENPERVQLKLAKVRIN